MVALVHLNIGPRSAIRGDQVHHAAASRRRDGADADGIYKSRRNWNCTARIVEGFPMARRPNVEAYRPSADLIPPMVTNERSGSRRFADSSLAHDEIAERAYDLFLARGSEDGHDLDDWLEAERRVQDAAGHRLGLQ